MLRPRYLLALLPFLAACGDNQDPGGAAELWDRIHEEDYTSWGRAPGYESTRASSAPHSDQVDIYVNDVVAAALAAGDTLSEWPLDSLIVKDGFTDGGELAIVAAMEKRDAGWFWVEWTDTEAGGDSAKYSGSPSICTDCHSAGSDFVRAFTLP